MKRETVTSGKASVILSALLMLLTFTVLPARGNGDVHKKLSNLIQQLNIIGFYHYLSPVHRIAYSGLGNT